MEKPKANKLQAPFTRKEYETAPVLKDLFSYGGRYPDWVVALGNAGIIEMKVVEIVVKSKSEQASVIQKFLVLDFKKGEDFSKRKPLDPIDVKVNGKDIKFPLKTLAAATEASYVYDENVDDLYSALIDDSVSFKGE